LFKTQRLAIELSRNHAPTPTAAAVGCVADMSHVSLLEQSLDNIDDDEDHLVTKQQSDVGQVIARQVQSGRPRVTVHTALDVETASGIVNIVVPGFAVVIIIIIIVIIILIIITILSKGVFQRVAG